MKLNLSQYKKWTNRDMTAGTYSGMNGIQNQSLDTNNDGRK